MDKSTKTKLSTRQRKRAQISPKDHITVAFQQIKGTDKNSVKQNKFVFALSQLKKAKSKEELRNLKTLIDKKSASLNNEEKKITAEFKTLAGSIYNETLKKVGD
jgi:chaperonin cofactor prefoldin